MNRNVHFLWRPVNLSYLTSKGSSNNTKVGLVWYVHAIQTCCKFRFRVCLGIWIRGLRAKSYFLSKKGCQVGKPK